MSEFERLEREALHPYWLQFLGDQPCEVKRVPPLTLRERLDALVNRLADGINAPAPQG